MAEKATNAEMVERIDKIIEKVLFGATRSEIVRFCSESWGIGERQSEVYLNKAWSLIREASEIKRADLVVRHIRRLDDVARRAIQSGNQFAELRAYELQAKITGMEIAPAEQTPRIDVSDDELDKVIEQETRVH